MIKTLVLLFCMAVPAWRAFDLREEELQLCHQLRMSLYFNVDFEADNKEYYPYLDLQPIKDVLKFCPGETVDPFKDEKSPCGKERVPCAE